jgi:hypothetical protein
MVAVLFGSLMKSRRSKSEPPSMMRPPPRLRERLNMSTFKITNAKTLNKGTLVGVFDLEFPSGLQVVGAKLMSNEKRHWIAFPSRPWTNKDGKTEYADIIKFSTKEAKDRFIAQVLPLAEGEFA